MRQVANSWCNPGSFKIPRPVFDVSLIWSQILQTWNRRGPAKLWQPASGWYVATFNSRHYEALVGVKLRSPSSFTCCRLLLFRSHDKGVVLSSPTSSLHRGHEALIFNHLSTHSAWKRWEQGSSRSSSLSTYVAKQIQHSCTRFYQQRGR